MASIILERVEIIPKSGCRGGGVCDDLRAEGELDFLFRRVRGRRRVGVVVVDMRVGVEVHVGVVVSDLLGRPRSFS